MTAKVLQGALSFKILQAAPGQGKTFVMLLVAHYALEHNRANKVFLFNPNAAVTAQIEHLVTNHPPS